MKRSTVHPHKALVVDHLKNLLSTSKSVAIVDYKGLKVSQVTQLRRDIAKAGGDMVVAKNTLFKIASGHTDLTLEGTSAFIFSQSDEVSALKAVADFAKKNGTPTFKLGFLSDRMLSTAEVITLASLPDRATLVGKLLGSLKSPLYGLAHALNWNISKLVRTLDAIKASKST